MRLLAQAKRIATKEMFDLVPILSYVKPGATEASEALSSTEALAVSITMEGLLFAAFAVGNKLTEKTEKGRSPFYTQGWFGWCVVFAIGLIAAGAGTAWWELFGHGWPESFSQFFLGLGLAVGIVSQPIFAATINYESRKT
ncbi:MAG TPA: hypothetical protein VGC63_13855 [Solirubrobacterales bacterium]